MNSFDRLAVQQLDKQSAAYKKLIPNQPQEGWIRLVRSVLSMPASYLSKKLKISQPTLVGLEKSEKVRTITLASLDKIAKEINCKLVYGFVPKESYEAFIKKAELKAATEAVERVQKTMSLEDQGLTDKQKADQINLILEEIKGQPLKKLWK